MVENLPSVSSAFDVLSDTDSLVFRLFVQFLFLLF